MPLKAIVDGETVIGPDLSRGEWAILKLRHKKGLPITMGCCGAPGHVRVSKKGTQHFYHVSDTGCAHEEESHEHLEIKEEIYRTCTSEGWETSVEFAAPDRAWIADVCAVRDGRKIVFEIQISTISPDELGERDRKYREEGIESYWLLDNFLRRSRDFKSWYDSHLQGDSGRQGEKIPYVDYSVFDTGPENHIFFAKGIRSVGLHAKKQTLFTTHNPEIPLTVWVKEVLKGNYRNYLEESSAAIHQKRRLTNLAAPALIRFWKFYQKTVRNETCRKKVDLSYRIFKTATPLRNERNIQKKFDELYAETDWLEKEYRSCIAESSGLFTWKKISGHDIPKPFFRLESPLKIRKLEKCVQMFSQWEGSFDRAFSTLKAGISR